MLLEHFLVEKTADSGASARELLLFVYIHGRSGGFHFDVHAARTEGVEKG